MEGRLLLRFDDICPTMNWNVWGEVERVLIEADVKPLLAIVPDNRDPALEHSPARADFWDAAREWQARGWTLAVHGYQHRYETGSSGTMRINAKSEFAGLPAGEQARKIGLALEIFRRERIEPRVWIAPGHSFDAATLSTLSAAGLQSISDGFGLLPYRDDAGRFWVPQQLWHMRKMPVGVWTVCLHHNSWSDAAVRRFRADVARHRGRITSFDELSDLYCGRKRSLADRGCEIGCRLALDVKRAWWRIGRPSPDVNVLWRSA